MAEETVVLKSRDVGKSAARACRRNGLVPGIIYGKSMEPVAVSLDAKAARKIMGGKGGHIHHVLVEGSGFEGDVMVQDVAYDPLSGRPVHVDLHRVSLTEKVRAEVPLAIVGEDRLERRGLILQRQLREVTVECLPTEIPDALSVDVAELKHGDSITAGQLRLPPGVRLVTLPNEVLVVAVVPKAVEEKAEEKAEEAAAPAAPTGGTKAEKTETPKD